MFKLERTRSESESTSGVDGFAPFYCYTVKDHDGKDISGIISLEIMMDTKSHAVPEVYIHRVSLDADGRVQMLDGEPVETVELLLCSDLSFTADYIGKENTTTNDKLQYNVG